MMEAVTLKNFKVTDKINFNEYKVCQGWKQQVLKIKEKKYACIYVYFKGEKEWKKEKI